MSEEELVENLQTDLKLMMEPDFKVNTEFVMRRIHAWSAALSALSAHRQAEALESINQTVFSGFQFVGDR